MSDEQTQQPTPQTLEVEYETQSYEEGTLTGYKFVCPKFNSVDRLRADYGDEIILALCNTIIAAKLRTKVKIDPDHEPKEEIDPKTKKVVHKEKPEEFHARLKKLHPDGVLFTQADAQKWKPGVREETAAVCYKKAQDLFAKGDVAGGLAMLDRMKAKMLEQNKETTAVAGATA